MSSEFIVDLIGKGTVATVLAVVAVLLWRALEKKNKEQREDRAKSDAAAQAELEKQTATLNIMAERLIRIDNRTARISSPRAKTPTPFFPRRPGHPEDDEEEGP